MYPLLYSVSGYWYCDLLLAKGEHAPVLDRAAKILEWEADEDPLLDRALVRLTMGRAHRGLAVQSATQQPQSVTTRNDTIAASTRFDEAVDGLRAAGELSSIAYALLARAAFRCNTGDWDGVARDLDEVEEIAELGPMKLFLCDMALERARLAFARIEAFAPLNGLIDNSPRKPVVPDATELVRLKEEAARQLAIAADYIQTSGYHRRDEELAELEAVMRGDRKFADLPHRV